MLISGCTNTLASNYNPSANFNDGSCVFQSGCTQPFADNYDPDAVVEDGSCYCGEVNLLLELSPTGTTLSSPTGETCQWVLGIDILLEIECASVLEFVINHSGITLTETINQIEYGLLVISSGTTLSEKTLYQNSIYDSVGLIDTSGLCEGFYEILVEENQLGCKEETKFVSQWKHYEVLLDEALEGQTIEFAINFKGIPFDHTILVDNVELNSICTKTVESCTILPVIYGFELEKKVNTEKITLDNTNIANSGELLLRLNPLKYVEQDIVDFFNSKKYFLSNDTYRELTVDIFDSLSKIKKECLYRFYLENCASKQLNENYPDKVYERINPAWWDVMNQFIPSGAQRDDGKYYYRNLLVYPQVHAYGKESCLEYDQIYITKECGDCTEETVIGDCDQNSLLSNNGFCLLSNAGNPLISNQ